MIKLFDRVKVNIPTTGTGDIEFGAAASTAFLTPTEAGVLDGDEVRYVIVDGLDFEEGVGLIKDTVATMERSVTKSKIGGVVGTSPINLSGTAVLALTASAADIGSMKGANNLSDLDDADAALSNLGAGAKGKSLFAADDESDVLDALPSVYHLDNIIGTVAYSGGKNTGAIIETGSNANGTYIKWADGTMICTHYVLRDDQTTTTIGGVAISPSYDWTFPSVFVGQPGVHINGASFNNNYYWGSANLSGNTTVDYRMVTTVASTEQQISSYLLAVGRWRA